MTAPRFQAGDRVRVLDLGKPGHVRIPFFIRHRTGVVERHCGAYPNPEELAYGNRDAARVDLYRVHFRQAEIWPDYTGPARDTLELEVYDHWLAPAEGRAA